MAIKLSELVQSGAHTLPPRLCIFGPQAVGKTTFAAGFKNVIGLLTEDGIGNLNFPRVLCPDYQTLLDSLDALIREEHSYKTVFIDSLDWTEQKIWKAVCSENGKQNIEDFGYGKGYQYALTEWSKLLSKLDELRQKKKMLVLLVGHSIVKPFNPPDSESYDRYRLDLNEKAASLILDWLDVLLFATYRTITKESQDGKRRLAVGEGERVIYTEERPAFWAKNRFSLPFELPLDQQVFMDALRKGAQANARNKGKEIKGETTSEDAGTGTPGHADHAASVQ